MKTHITFVLDSSGSMSKIEEDTKGGFNSFLQDQIDEEGTATVSLYEFNTDVELVYGPRPIEEAPELTDETYTPGGRTALHDAIARAIEDTATYIDEQEDSERPDNVIVVSLTDGKENASETPQKIVRERVEDKRENDGWEFLFIGANQDAALTASGMGMDADKALDMDHSGEGTQAAYAATSRSISRARRQGETGGFDDTNRSRDGEDSTPAKRNPDDAQTGEHDDVTAVAGLNPYWVCATCKLAAVDSADLADYPCVEDKYHPRRGEGLPEPLREERLAWDILRLGEDTDVVVPEDREELPGDARDWLEQVEEYSDRIRDQPEPEKLRIAIQWAEEDWDERFPPNRSSS